MNDPQNPRSLYSDDRLDGIDVLTIRRGRPGDSGSVRPSGKRGSPRHATQRRHQQSLIRATLHQPALTTRLREAAELPVVIINPRRVREFAKRIGRLAKPDKLDARVLAHYSAATIKCQSSLIRNFPE